MLDLDRPTTLTVLPPMKAPKPRWFGNRPAGLAPTPPNRVMSRDPQPRGRACTDEACGTLLSVYNHEQFCAPHARERVRAHFVDTGTDQHPQGCRCKP